MEKKLSDYKPSSYFTWSVHLDGMKDEHDKAVCQEGVFDRCVSAIKKAKSSNMPSSNIERAIKKGQGNDPDTNYEEVRYLSLIHI